MEVVLAALAQHGPTAILAGAIIWVLWKKLTALQVYYEGDPSDKDKPGKIATMQRDAQEREDKLRDDYDRKVKEERDAQKLVMDDLLSTLRGEE